MVNGPMPNGIIGCRVALMILTILLKPPVFIRPDATVIPKTTKSHSLQIYAFILLLLGRLSFEAGCNYFGFSAGLRYLFKQSKETMLKQNQIILKKPQHFKS
jgi:hypothetical protein